MACHTQQLPKNIFFGKFEFSFSSCFLNRKEAGVSRGKNTEIQFRLFIVNKQEGREAIYFAENALEDASKTQHF